ncbi:hypothetical protein [Deinococcus sonorensis]|uniref:Lipoprotein n=1 Tax=Deinococcus sonorensis KR-87 TaxID=694439 RepID=A0AAU7U896_9DEIO
MSLIALLAACNTAAPPAAQTPAGAPPALTAAPVQAAEPGQAPSRLTAAVVNQLEQAQTNLDAQALPLRLVSYTFGPGLESAAQVTAMGDRLVADQTVVPQYDGVHPDSFTLNTIQERMRAFQTDQLQHQDVVSNIRSTVLPLLNVGQGTVRLTWQSEGKQFQTTGVYDRSGLVYDSLLSNIVLVQDDTAPQTASTTQAGARWNHADASVQPMSTRARTARALSLTLKWVWGGTRGKITVDHTVIIKGSKFIDQSGSAHYYMNLGSAGAKTRNTVLKATQLAKLAYGYAWATPTASFSISFDAKKGDVGGSFKVSLKGLGSKGGGDAHHTFYF